MSEPREIPQILPEDKRHEVKENFEGRLTQRLTRGTGIPPEKMHKGASGKLYETEADMLVAGDHPRLDSRGEKRIQEPWPPKPSPFKPETNPLVSEIPTPELKEPKP